MVHYFEPPIETDRFLGVLDRQHRTLKRKRRPRDKSAKKSTGGNDSAADDVAHSQSADDNDGDDSDRGPNFPHAPLKSEKSKRVNASQRSLKHQHFNVLNALLHKCLQEHDYKRAGRAFAALLRFEINGLHMDLRKRGLWGIGAEILLRNFSSDQSLTEELLAKHGSLNFSHPSAHEVGDSQISQSGFKAARQYLDRLILQYPYKKNRPSDLSAQQLHCVMISLWIFQIQAEAQHTLHALGLSTQTNKLSGSKSSKKSQKAADKFRDTAPEIRQSRLDQLRQAEEVREKLDELILSPPYDRDVHLLKLRGHVGLWMRDLVLDTSLDKDDNETVVAASAHLDASRGAFQRAEAAAAGPLTDPDHTQEDSSAAISPAPS